MIRRTSLALVSFSVACTLEPSYVGPWDIDRVVHDGEVLEDAGFVEFQEKDRAVYWFLRYDFDRESGTFVPRTQPELAIGSFSTTSEEQPGKSAIDGYASKGERFFVNLAEWGALFRVEDYDQRSLVLVADETVWFQPGLDLSTVDPSQWVRTELHLLR